VPQPSPGAVPERFRTYVALGDSFTEGVGDPDPDRPHGVRGWADRVAEAVSRRDPDLAYANLAIRGRTMAAVLEHQVEPALSMRPDLVSVYAGGNDIMRPVVDIDAIVAAYAAALRRLRDAGAHLVVFTGFDLGWAPVFGRLRGRVAVYNELVREVADDLGATLVDFWRMRDYRRSSMWDVDRTHMSSLGHRHMAVAVLDALGVPHDLTPPPPEQVPALPPSQRRRQDLAWARSHAAPWVHRRLTGRSSGDGLTPRFPSPVAARGLGTRSGTI
jgi:lysophospholipase L1-like esterase